VSTLSGDRDFRLGLLFATGSAFTFSLSGPFAKSLLEAGWSPTAAVCARLLVGAVVMALFATLVKPAWMAEAWAHRRTVLAYGLIPIAGAQLCYFNAVAHLSVGVALLLEYTSPILVVLWLWATTRRRPGAMTLGGVGLALVGVTVVLDVVNGARINGIGVVWGLAAAVCAACYYLMSGRAVADGSGLGAVALATGGLVVAAVAISALGATGVLPVTFTTNDAVIAGTAVHWIIPVLMVGVVAAAIAYTLGIAGVARLRPGFASLLGLSEVLFAVLAAWVLLGEAISTTQAIGGAIVLVGLALARQGHRSAEVTAATWPDVGAIELAVSPPVTSPRDVQTPVESAAPPRQGDPRRDDPGRNGPGHPGRWRRRSGSRTRGDGRGMQ